MAKEELNYTSIDAPYNNQLQKVNPVGKFEAEATVGIGSPNQIKENIVNGEAMDDMRITNWIKSNNYKPGVAGFKIDGMSGDVEFGNGKFRGDITGATGTFSGSVIVGNIHIPDKDTTADSFHVQADANTWWGCTETDFNTDNNNAKAYILKTGVAKFQEIVLETNVVLSGLQTGSSLAIQYIDAGTITSKIFNLDFIDGTGDVAIRCGKSDFGDDTNGFILGVDDSDSNKIKFEIGNATNYLKWTGSALNIKGEITATTGEIGGWTIGATALTAASIILDSENKRIEVGTANKIFIDGENKRIQSDNYVSGTFGAGFHLSDNLLEVGNIACRGLIRTAVFEKLAINVMGGNFLTLNGDILDEDMTVDDDSTITIKGTTTFSVGDILRMKATNGANVDDEWLEVTARNDNIYTVTRDKAGDYGVDDNPSWKKGVAIVDYGQSGDGGIYQTASENNAPYLSVFTHSGNPWTDISTKLRLGNLNGFLGYATDSYGIAIGETNKYLKYDPTNGLRIRGTITIENPGDINGSTINNDSGWTDDITATQAIEDAANAQATADGKIITFYQDNVPTATSIGDLWIDTNDGNKLYRAESVGADQITAGEWVEIQDADIAQAIADAGTAQATADNKIVTFFQNEVPTATDAGDLWFDTNDKNKCYRATNAGDNQIIAGEWEAVRDTDIGQAITDAANAQATADGKIITFYQDEEPTGGESSIGDLWIDTNDGNKLYRYSGAAWVEIQDNAIQTALTDASNAQTTADGKIVTFFQDAQPTADGTGDIWIDTDDNNKPYRWSGSVWEAMNNPTDWDDVLDSSLNKPDDNATVGADWGSNLINIPGTLEAPSGAGLYLGATHLGYYDSANWKTYMDSSGNFYLGGTSGKLQWNAGTDTLAIEGNLTITGGSGIANLDGGDLVSMNEAEIDQTALLNSAEAGADVTQTVIDGGLITTGSITLNAAGNIKSGKTNYADTDAGFWLGNDAGTPKFNIGNSTDYLKWDGSNVKMLCSSENAIIVGYGSDILLEHGGDIKFTSVIAPTACTVALIETAGNVDVGTHKYVITYINEVGETNIGAASNIVTNDTTHKQNSLTNIPISSSKSIIGRRIYRTNTSGEYRFLVEINDNTTTTYTDNIADADLIEMGDVEGIQNSSFGKIFVDDISVLSLAFENSFIGQSVGMSNTTGYSNVAVGAGALRLNTIGTDNTVLGLNALSNNILGSHNTAIGAGTLLESIGSNNTAVGGDALRNNESNNQTAIGFSALYSNTTGDENTAIGYNALYSNVTGAYNTAIGHETLFNNIKDENIAIGFYALRSNTNGSSNISIGNSSLRKNTTGDKNTGIGHLALNKNVSGSSNIAIGFCAGQYELGSNAFYVNNQSRVNTTGDKTKSLMYGIMATTQTDQILRLTASVGINTVDFGSGKICLALANATTVPSVNPSGGGVIYCEGGALKYRSQGGLVTTIAPNT